MIKKVFFNRVEICLKIKKVIYFFVNPGQVLQIELLFFSSQRTGERNTKILIKSRTYRINGKHIWYL